ncbi:MAG: thioredoxin [Gammaproteobacteria bacterium]|nr:thioredoxin [Gammaproteobacteria bacterium]
MSDSEYIVDVTLENFEEVVLNSSMQQPVLVDFWADWCQPCQALIPVLSKLAEEYQGQFILAKVNSDEQQEIAVQFGVRSLPTVKVLFQGQIVDEFMGAIPESEIRELLSKHITAPPAAPESIEEPSITKQAETLFQAGEQSTALQLLEKTRAEQPEESELTLCHAKLLLKSLQVDEALAVLKQLPRDARDSSDALRLQAQAHFTQIAQSSKHSETQLQQQLEQGINESETLYQLAALKVAQGEFEAALDLLLTLLQKDRSYNDDAARKGMLEIFNIIEGDPLVSQFRRRMFNFLH